MMAFFYGEIGLFFGYSVLQYILMKKSIRFQYRAQDQQKAQKAKPAYDMKEICQMDVQFICILGTGLCLYPARLNQAGRQKIRPK